MIILGGNKKAASVIVARHSDESAKSRNEKAYEERSEEPEGYESDMLELASDIMKAAKASDVKALKDALQSFFYVCDAQPHKEGEHK